MNTFLNTIFGIRASDIQVFKKVLFSKNAYVLKLTIRNPHLLRVSYESFSLDRNGQFLMRSIAHFMAFGMLAFQKSYSMQKKGHNNDGNRLHHDRITSVCENE